MLSELHVFVSLQEHVRPMKMLQTRFRAGISAAGRASCEFDERGNVVAVATVAAATVAAAAGTEMQLFH